VQRPVTSTGITTRKSWTTQVSSLAITLGYLPQHLVVLNHEKASFGLHFPLGPYIRKNIFSLAFTFGNYLSIFGKTFGGIITHLCNGRDTHRHYNTRKIDHPSFEFGNYIWIFATTFGCIESRKKHDYPHYVGEQLQSKPQTGFVIFDSVSWPLNQLFGA
jgi:hypothetical protein